MSEKFVNKDGRFNHGKWIRENSAESVNEGLNSSDQKKLYKAFDDYVRKHKPRGGHPVEDIADMLSDMTGIDSNDIGEWLTDMSGGDSEIQFEGKVNKALVKEEYIEIMHDLDDGLALIRDSWLDWKNGPVTEKGDIKPAQKELVTYIVGWLKKNIK